MSEGLNFTAIIALLIFIAIYITLYLVGRRIKSTTKYMKNLPGPKPIFPFGNTLDFLAGSTVMISKFIEYLNTYGDTVLIHDGTFNWTVISRDYEYNELLLNSTVHIEKANHYKFLHGWLGQGLLTSTGAKWKSRRKLITPSFHFSILPNFLSVFDSVGENLLRKLRTEVGKDSIDISKIISLYTLDVICEASMGVKVNALDQENSKYVNSVKNICRVVSDRVTSVFNPILYPLTWNYYSEKRSLKVIHKYVEMVIDERVEEKKQKTVESENNMKNDYGMKKRLAFLDMLLDARIDGEPLSRVDLRDEVNTFMFEGHDTTSAAITFCLLMLAQNPEVQAKAIKEQLDIFGSNMQSAVPTYKQLNEMKYLDLVIKETLRLYPPVPFIGRKLAKDTEFKGTLFPKGLNVMMFPFAYQRNPEYFPDPEKFIPERFKTFNGKLIFAYTPFSAGPRNCIGQKFAMLEMLSTLSKILRNFELAPAKPEHKIQLAAENILISKTGVRISLQKRTHYIEK